MTKSAIFVRSTAFWPEPLCASSFVNALGSPLLALLPSARYGLGE